MLQSTSISKVYGHGHIKKFWLMQNQKESENKALLGSSSASPSRLGGSSAGLGHESKQGTQFCLGNTSSRSLSLPSGVPVRPLVSGPPCFNMARYASLVTYAESLSPPLRADQPRSLLRPSSPSDSVSTSIEKNTSLAGDDDYELVKSPCRGDDISVATSSPFKLSRQLGGDASYNYPFTAKTVFDPRVHDNFSLSKDSLQGGMFLQERFDHGKTSEDVSCESRSLESYKCSLGIFSNLESSAPFSVPFQLPEKYFKAEAKPFDRELVRKSDVCVVPSDRTCPGKSGSSSVPSLPDRAPGKRELSEMMCGKEDAHPVSIGVLLTCLVCGTSKTPLWRSGPQGPKSLCNACGIRFKKAKRGSEGPDCSASPLASPHYMKSLFKPAKRKQDTSASFEAHSARPLVLEAPTGLATQAAKKRRWSRLMKKGDFVIQKREVTGSSGESSLTWNVHSPSAISSPSLGQFEKLSIEEKVTTLDMISGKDEEEAAVLLMYMSSGLVFA